MGLAYVLWAPTAFFQVLRNGDVRLRRRRGRTRSTASSTLFLDQDLAKIVVGVIAYVGLVVIAWMLSKVVPWTAVPGLPKGADLRRDPLTIAVRTSLVLSVAWLVTSMYTLSWYDLIAWIPLSVLAASKLDKIMLMRIAPLSLAYVPGRAIDYGAALDFTATRIRDTVSPIIQILVLLAIVLWWKKPDRPELWPIRKEPRDGAIPPRALSSPSMCPEPLTICRSRLTTCPGRCPGQEGVRVDLVQHPPLHVLGGERRAGRPAGRDPPTRRRPGRAGRRRWRTPGSGSCRTSAGRRC